ncbi:MAG: hypothetical protein AVDCRST_MAG51-2146, partial [uncultured Ramlibacter sp.]
GAQARGCCVAAMLFLSCRARPGIQRRPCSGAAAGLRIKSAM